MTRFLCFLACLLVPFRGLAAPPEPRAEWLRQELYAYNHPWAAQAPDELATKMKKMAADPFGFLRGSAHLFYRDMARLPAPDVLAQPVLLNGDAHLANFGCSVDGAGTPIFALDDFDEAASGPAAWDLRRLATSLVLLGRAAKLSESAQGEAVDAMVEAYLARLEAFVGGMSPRAFRLGSDNTQGEVRDCIEDAGRRQRGKWLSKNTRISRGQREFKIDDELRAPDAATRDAVLEALKVYATSVARPSRFFAPKDLRRKLGSGIGSLGRLRYWVLIEGDGADDGDDIVLELKQATAASLTTGQGATAGEPASRVLAALRAQLAQPDPLAGVMRIGDQSYLVREKSPQQEDLRLDKLDSPRKLSQAAALAGSALGHAHALSASPRQVAELARADRVRACEALRRFALDYASRVTQDWKDFKAARPERFY